MYQQREGFTRMEAEHYIINADLEDTILMVTAKVVENAINKLAEQEPLATPFVSHGTIHLDLGQEIVITIELVLPKPEERNQ